VTRTCAFGPLTVSYDERVLAPRPWTFEQSRWAAELAADAAPGPVLELCAGAGHIGLAAAVLADRDLVQVEADPIAARYARDNAGSAGRGGRVQVRVARLESALDPQELFALILADPPYLPSREIERWPEDPQTAIDGGTDGLELIKQCLAVAAEHLTADGQLLLQVAGPPQVDQVRDLLAAAPAVPLLHRASRVVDPERAIMLIGRR
jgi:release factor glutamine methyltransferase